MSELRRCVSPAEEIELAREIERLFVFQDRPLPASRTTMIVKELSESGIPFRAIMAGIKKLCAEDLKQIKISTIFQAAREFMVFEEPKGCGFCHGTGFVDMVNKDMCPIVYPCACEKGKWLARNQKLTQWNGKRQMFSHRYEVVKLAWHYDGMNISDMADEEFSATASGNQTELETAWVD